MSKLLQVDKNLSDCQVL